MAALTITASDVSLTSGVKSRHKADATIKAGQLVYLKPSGLVAVAAWDDKKTAKVAGMALADAVKGRYVWVGRWSRDKVSNSAVIDIGTAVTIGLHYYLNGTNGGVGLFTDVTSGNYAFRFAITTATDTLSIHTHSPLALIA